MLRHLVVRDELEFDPVFRVQEKRLGVDLSDAEMVWELGLFAQEGIAALLREGGARGGRGGLARRGCLDQRYSQRVETLARGIP